MGPVTLGGLAGIFNLFWRKRQGDLLLLELGTPHRSSHKLPPGGRTWGSAHPPKPADPLCASAATVAFGMPQGFSFAKAPGGLVGSARAVAAGGSVVGNFLAPRRGWRGRHAVSSLGKGGARAGRSWGMRRTCLEGAPGLGCSMSTRGTCCPMGPCPPRRFPRQLQLLQGEASTAGTLCSASPSVRSPKIHALSQRHEGWLLRDRPA